MRGRWGSSLLPPPASRLPPTPPAPLTSSTPGPPPAPSPRRPGAPPARPRARPLAWRLPAGLRPVGPLLAAADPRLPSGAAGLAPWSPARHSSRASGSALASLYELVRTARSGSLGPCALCLPPPLRAVTGVWQDWGHFWAGTGERVLLPNPIWAASGLLCGWRPVRFGDPKGS